MEALHVEAEPTEAPPPPPKLERQTNQKAYSREEALCTEYQVEVDEYDKVVNEPVAPVVVKAWTRVDQLRALVRNELPSLSW